MKLSSHAVRLAMAFFAGFSTLFAQDMGDAVLLRIDDEIQQVRVEAMDTATGRWLAIASGYRDTMDKGWLKVALPDGYSDAELRVLGNTTASPFAGKVRDAASASDSIVAYPPGTGRWASMEDTTGSAKSADAVIEEADIWAWENSTLYFYNQYRGLQVIDMANPEEPQWLDYFRYPAKGEDLYAPGHGPIILLGTGSYWGGDKVALQFLDFDGNELALQDTVELEAGQYLDSRRYGDYLYVTTREWVDEINPDGQVSRAPFIRLYTVALSDASPDRLVDVKSFEGDGWLDAVLTAQPDGILLSLNKWYGGATDWRFRWRSEVHVLVPGAGGVPEEVGVARLAGVVQDKFKMNFKDGLLTTISQQADWSTGQFTRATKLENFILGDNGFTRTGFVDLAPGESLFASRFYGDTVYIVTFLFVDPLFAIDNSIPSRPVIAGELEVPGWSNYIEWVDDQLFAVGIEERNLTVSIFDVADPANMSLKDRVFLGADSWAWSEAQYDDQAISFFPDVGMLMLPFTSWSWESSKQVQAMQLITWDEAGLQLRGQVQHIDVPRRGVLVGDTVITVSGREVVTTNVSNPDVPEDGGSATLAWNVQHLIPHGEYWLQLESEETGFHYWRVPYDPGFVPEPILYVTSRDEPNVPETEVHLAAGRTIGVTHRDNLLILLQDISEKLSSNYWEIPEVQSLAVRTYDVTDPLAPVMVGESILEDIPYLGGSFDAHLMGDGSILWASQVSLNLYYYAIDIWPGPGFYNNSLSYLVSTIGVDGSVEIPAHDVYATDDFWNQSSGWFWEDPLLIASMTTYEEREHPDAYPDYKAHTRMVVVDLTVPSEPVELRGPKLPSHLVAVESLEDGLNHYLYLEPDWTTVAVWGWDQAAAFPLFRQKLYPDESSGSYSYSFSWMAPFHMRSRYRYDNGSSTNSLDIWYHQADQNRFENIEIFSYENRWFTVSAVKESAFLLSTSNEVEVFEGNALNGTFERLHQLDLSFPNIYSLDLEASVLEPDALFVPVGIYGVETLPIPSATTRAASYMAVSVEGSSTWEVLPGTRWERVGKSVTDVAGSIFNLQWLYHPDSLMEVDPGASDAGDLWRESSWFGWYAHSGMKRNWIYHLEHGSLFTVLDEAPELNGFYLFDGQMGFLWTHSNTYPYLYDFSRAGWVYYLQGSGSGPQRWFYDFSSGWFSLDR
jgi:hypothetical protein